VELNGSRLEHRVARHFFVGQSGLLDDVVAQVEKDLVELHQVGAQNVTENHLQFVLFWGQATDGCEETHLSVVDLERSTLGVKACLEQHIA
jgi:hypothetical protein